MDKSIEIQITQEDQPIDYFFFQHGITIDTVDPIIHWKYFVYNIKMQLQTNYIFKYITCNSGLYKTLDGIEEGAERITEEVISELETIKSKNDSYKYRIHFVAHSLGGIYLRNVIPRLFKRGYFTNTQFVPFSFITLETPHCGVQKPEHNGTFDYFYKSVSNNYFKGKTVTQLSLQDRQIPMSPSFSGSNSSDINGIDSNISNDNESNDLNVSNGNNNEMKENNQNIQNNQRKQQKEKEMKQKKKQNIQINNEIVENINNNDLPLLMKMCDEEEYLQYLRQFKTLTLMQNIRFSYQVPYASAAIDRTLPYQRSSLKSSFLIDAYDFDSNYKDIMLSCDKHYELYSSEELTEDSVIIEKKDGCVLYNHIINRLNTLPWRRINVHFRTKSKDAHLFIMGDMHRNKYFKNWRNSDVDEYLGIVSQVIKRDIENYPI